MIECAAGPRERCRPDRAERDRAEQSRTEPSRAGAEATGLARLPVIELLAYCRRARHVTRVRANGDSRRTSGRGEGERKAKGQEGRRTDDRRTWGHFRGRLNERVARDFPPMPRFFSKPRSLGGDPFYSYPRTRETVIIDG